MRQLELALDQAGLRVEHVRLVVCTHAHSDHYGQAAPIMERTGAELWMHPNHEHMTKAAEDPERAFERRFEIARQSRRAGRRARGLQGGARRGQSSASPRSCMPDRELVPGRGGRDRPRHLAGLRDARPRALARGAPPARARPAAVGRPPARPRLALLRLRLLARTRPASSCRASTWSTSSTSSSCWPATAARCATRAPSPRRTGARSHERIERVRARARERPAHGLRHRARDARRRAARRR